MTKLFVIAISFLITNVCAEEEKMCRYRDEPLFPRSIWNLKAGAGCYSYLPKDWFVQKASVLTTFLTKDSVNYTIPFAQIKNQSVTFNYLNEQHSKIIASTFKTEAYYWKWESCAKNGDECCEYMTAENIKQTEEYPCAAVWDAWTCFGPAKMGSISKQQCPEYTTSANSVPCILHSQKQCWNNGTWNQQTDYSTCATAPVQRRRHNFHLIVLYISITLCLPAIIIFLSYRNLRILRVILHRNLLIACVMRNILAAVQKQIVVMDSLKPYDESSKILINNGTGCRILAVFANVSANAVYACMLLDAFYLHKLLVRIFSPDPNVYVMYGIGAALSIVPTAIWSALFATQADEYCWSVNHSWYQWIPDGVRIGILVVNVLLLLDIFRGLLTKLKHNVNTHHTKYTYYLIGGTFYTRNYVLEMAYISTLKAMLFLLPLFGVPFLLTANRDIVDRTSCLAGDIYYYISYAIQAFQGFMVALLYCYWNKEAQNLVKGSWNKLKTKYELKFEANNRRTTNTQPGGTRDTFVRTSGMPKYVIEKKCINT